MTSCKLCGKEIERPSRYQNLNNLCVECRYRSLAKKIREEVLPRSRQLDQTLDEFINFGKLREVEE